MSTLSNPSTIDTSASVDSIPKPLPRSQQSAKSKLPIQATPPLQDNNQLSLSFTNLLEDFKNDDGDVKSIKLAKEMISYNKNEMQIKIEDIYKHNQFLSDQQCLSKFHGRKCGQVIWRRLKFVEPFVAVVVFNPDEQTCGRHD